MHIVRSMLFVLLACCSTLTVTAPSHAQVSVPTSDLYEDLGFNVPCDGAVEPACKGPVTKVNSGTCYNYSCSDPVVVSDPRPDVNLLKMPVCKVYDACGTGFRETKFTDDKGCQITTCTKIRGCMPKNAVRCMPGMAVSSTGIDDAGCAIYACLPGACKVQAACGPGYGPHNKRVDENGCRVFDCMKIVCPVSSSIICKKGTVTVEGKDDRNGCKTFSCETVSTTTPVCPVAANCGPGTTKKDGPKDSKGCATFTCVSVSTTVPNPTCPVVQTCPTKYTATTTKDANGCPSVKCTQTTGTCPVIPASCAVGEKLVKGADDSRGCATAKCEKVVCPVYGECPANYKRTTTKGADGCDSVKCIKTTGACPVLPTSCAKGEKLVKGADDSRGCDTAKCEKVVCAVYGECLPGYKRSVTKNADDCDVVKCVKTVGTCPVLPTTCAKGEKLVKGADDSRGCDTAKCEKVVCPIVQTCPPGSKTTEGTNADGCKTIKCTQTTDACPVLNKPVCKTGEKAVTGKDAKGCATASCEKIVCPVAANCGPGTKRVDGKPDANGCDTFKCEKITCKPVPYMKCGAGGKVEYSRDANGCMTAACVGGAPTCPAIGSCAPGNTMKLGVDAKGCKTVTCTPEPVCPTPVVVQCDAGETRAINIDDKGCKVQRCIKVRECEDNLRACQTGYSRVADGFGTNGCAKYKCEKPACPAVANCGPGFTGKTSTVNGCPKITCTKNPTCEKVKTCKSNQLTVTDINKNGCKVVKCIANPSEPTRPRDCQYGVRMGRNGQVECDTGVPNSW